MGLSTFTAMAQVQSLVRELRPHKLRGLAKEKKKKETVYHRWLGMVNSSVFMKKNVLFLKSYITF